MSDFPFFTSVDFRLNSPLAPWSNVASYVTPITGRINVMLDEDDLGGHHAGYIKVLRINATQAYNEQQSLLEICDAHSAWLVSAYIAVFEQGFDTKPELDIEPTCNDILVLWGFKIKPEFRDTDALVCAFETAINVFGPQVLVLAARNDDRFRFKGLDLTVNEWRKLGFIRIARSQFMFRDNCCTNVYERNRIQDEE